jgi:hypothetical protein
MASAVWTLWAGCDTRRGSAGLMSCTKYKYNNNTNMVPVMWTLWAGSDTRDRICRPGVLYKIQILQ